MYIAGLVNRGYKNKMELRDYQKEAVANIHKSWNSGAQNVLIQLATGGGKSTIFSYIVANYAGASIIIAHRVELVSQISLTLARYGVRHNIIAQKHTVQEIIAIHMLEVGRNYYCPHANRFIAGVDSLIRLPKSTPWFKKIELIVQDEGHHVTVGTKWHKAAGLFPQAKGLYPTATPLRSDGKGLGRHADGVVDELITGVSMRELISQGYLTDYRIFAPPSDLDLSSVHITGQGEYSPPKLRNAVNKSHITGDVVEHYIKLASGKLGVTFAVSVEAALEITREYRKQGVSAELITAKTPALERTSIMRRFRNRQVMQLVNVDILGEGIDVPAIECVSFARPTASYGLYVQQFGRGLRLAPGKEKAIIIDHVGNVIRHGLPDRPREWTLDRQDRKARSAPTDVIPLRNCNNIECMGVYLRTQRVCPMCGHYPEPKERSSPAQVDGDLLELDSEMLRKLRGEIDRIDAVPRIPGHLDRVAQQSLINKHKARFENQQVLRMAIADYAGYLKLSNMSDSEMYRHFYFNFGIDVATAQTLGSTDAFELTTRIVERIDKMRNSP
jgi:DNA repair protein RadD